MTKKASLEQFHRENISTAAYRIFRQNGIEKTTMDEIAREAEYSKATLYVYFNSKTEIVNYLILNSMQVLEQKFAAAIAQNSDALRQYEELCRGMVEMYEQNPYAFEMILGTIPSGDVDRAESQILQDVFMVGERINGHADVIVKNGMKQGYFKEYMTSIQTGFFYWASLAGIIMMANKKEDYIKQSMKMDKQEFLEKSFTMLLQSGLKEGIKYEK